MIVVKTFLTIINYFSKQIKENCKKLQRRFYELERSTLVSCGDLKNK